MIKLKDLLSGTTRDPFTGALYEGLINTVETTKAAEILARNNREIVAQSVPYGDEIFLRLTVRYPDATSSKYTTGNTVDSNLSKLLQNINNLGYFIGGFKHGKTKDASEYEKYTPNRFRDVVVNEQPPFLLVVLAAKYDQDITEDLPKTLYHVTKDKYLDKIRKIGLKPTTKSKLATHPERVYVAFEEDSVRWIAKQMGDLSTEPQTILIIDTTKLPKNLKFYLDPHYIEGAYTHGNIPPSAIIGTTPYKLKK